MDQATKNKYIAAAKTRPVTNGRVCIGRGLGHSTSHRKVLGFKRYNSIYVRAYDSDGKFDGTDTGVDYWISVTMWAKLFGANNLPNAAKKVAKKTVKTAVKAAKPAPYLKPLKRTNQEMLDLSKELPKEYYDVLDWDKNIVYRGVELTAGVEIAIGVDGIEGYTHTKIRSDDKEIIEALAKTATPVWFMEGEDVDGKDILVFLNPEFGYTFQKSPETIEVNGYDGKDKGTYWEFGCAKISKDDLRVALNFLRSRPKGNIAGSNRRINSVKIGDGEFTLEILEKMNLGA